MVDKKSPLMYQTEVNNFLTVFARPPKDASVGVAIAEMESVRSDLIEAMKLAMNGKLPAETTKDKHPVSLGHPITVTKHVLKKRKLIPDKEEFAKISELIEKTYPVEGSTGLYAKQCMPVMVGLAHMLGQSEGNEIPVSLVEGDFSNMGGANRSHLGRQGTDKLIKLSCAMVKDCFTEYAMEHKMKPPVVDGIRAGGDEVRFIVKGMPAERVQDVLATKVHPKMNLLAAEFGVHKTPHEKKNKLPGFGAAFGAVDLTDSRVRKSEVIRATLNTQIEKRKDIDGMLRYGVIDAEGVDRFIKNIIEPPLLEQKLPPEEMDKILLKERADAKLRSEATAELWAKMRSDTAFPKIFHGVKTDPQTFFDTYSKIQAKSIDSKLAGVHVDNGMPRVPFNDQDVKDLGDAPESMRLRKALSALGFGELAKADALFQWDTELRRYDLTNVRDREDPIKIPPERSKVLRVAIELMRQYDSLDPSARCKTASLMTDDAVNFMKRHDIHTGLRVVHFELGNMNGLNSVNYDLADAALRETSKYIQDGFIQNDHGMGTNIMDHLYHEGGGKYKVLLPSDYSFNELKKVTDYVNEQLETNIRKRSITDFASLTYARPRLAKGVDRPSDEEILRLAKKDPDTIEKIQALQERLDVVGKEKGKTLVLMSDIPHPKDATKSMTFKPFCGQIDPNDVIRDYDAFSQKPQTIDPKMLKAKLGEITDRAEIYFNLKESGVAIGS